jgi:hypothetical protein
MRRKSGYSGSLLLKSTFNMLGMAIKSMRGVKTSLSRYQESREILSMDGQQHWSIHLIPCGLWG